MIWHVLPDMIWHDMNDLIPCYVLIRMSFVIMWKYVKIVMNVKCIIWYDIFIGLIPWMMMVSCLNMTGFIESIRGIRNDMTYDYIYIWHDAVIDMNKRKIDYMVINMTVMTWYDTTWVICYSMIEWITWSISVV